MQAQEPAPSNQIHVISSYIQFTNTLQVPLLFVFLET